MCTVYAAVYAVVLCALEGLLSGGLLGLRWGSLDGLLSGGLLGLRWGSPPVLFSVIEAVSLWYSTTS